VDLSFGPSTRGELVGLPGEKIAYIQFDDAPALESSDLSAETTNRRVVPGKGIFDLERRPPQSSVRGDSKAS
jgi:hypothetical protein